MSGQGGWQPIETAPKDGTRILTLDLDGETVEINYWWERPVWHFEEAGDGLYRKVFDPPYAAWSMNGHRATHWMHIPAAPHPASPDSAA